MAKMGRPRIEDENEEFETELSKLCFIQCTQEEIAGFFECSIDTLNNYCKRKHGKTFSEYRAQKGEGGKISLRRAMFYSATGPKANTVMQIWLSKNHLGMKDKVEETIVGDASRPIYSLPYRLEDKPHEIEDGEE